MENLGIEIELLGFRGRLTHLTSRLANPPWQKNDELLVNVEFDKPYPASFISTAIAVPVKEYSREELLKVVKVEGEKQLAVDIEAHRSKQAQYAAERQRKEELDALAHNIESVLGKVVD